MSYTETHEMFRREREARVLEIIREELSKPEIQPDAKVCDLYRSGSIEKANIFLRLVEEFQIWIPEIEADLCFTVGDVIALVNRRVEYQETEGRR